VNVFRARVLPQPELRIVLDGHGNVLSSHADLALLLLDEPVTDTLAFPPLAGTEAHAGESLVVVGYGYDELTDGHDGDRRASSNKVLHVSTPLDDGIAIEQPGRHLYKEDSGGPCLREGPRGPELVGISSRDLGERATCTSLQPYLKWLRAVHP
jgi:hypothetical protein